MQDNHNNDGSAISQKSAEIVVAIIIALFGAIVMWDSNRIGAGWGSDGPESGSFPFYVGLLIVISGVVTAINGFRADKEAMGDFVEHSQLRLVMAVLLPSIVYVIAIGFVGIYVASTIFIIAFMMWQGKFGALKSVSVAIPVNVFLFFMFEVWFTIPLPKGPLEAMFGY
jgi:putative tricarboxylic transport membrane protein